MKKLKLSKKELLRDSKISQVNKSRKKIPTRPPTPIPPIIPS